MAGVRVVGVSDELVLSSVARVEQELVAAIRSGVRAVLLDLTDCEFLDSSGLAMLVRTKRLMTGTQRLLLVVPQRIILRAFEAAHLDRVFEIHPTASAAIEGLRSPRRLGQIATRRLPENGRTGHDAPAAHERRRESTQAPRQLPTA